MFGSQALETAIGLTLLLFILASAASAILELGVRLSRKRANDLAQALCSLMSDKETKNLAKPNTREGEEVWAAFQKTSVYAAVTKARGTVRIPYLSAKAFAEGVTELVEQQGVQQLAGPLKDRVISLVRSTDADLTKFRAGLETWYDEAMAGVTALYRRWSTLFLGGIGLVLAVATNSSLPQVARNLWIDPATRETVVAAASQYSPPADKPNTSVIDELGRIDGIVSGLQGAQLPIGWSTNVIAELNAGGFWPWLGHALGWVLTAVLVALGAPFWFDLLGRLVAIRSPRPPKAGEDETSATRSVGSQKGGTGPTEGKEFWEQARMISTPANAGSVGQPATTPVE